MEKKFDNNSDEIMQILVDKTRKDPFFIGWALEKYERKQGINSEELSEWLQCSSKDVNRLALCRLPHDEDNRYQKEIEQIAEFVPCNPDRLIQLLRTVSAFTALQEQKKDEDNGFLLAARTHKALDEEEE